MASRIVIVGAGPAGITVAEALREHDRDVDITMLSSEPFPPYAPPAMADHFLTGRDDTLFWKGRDICERLDVDYRADTRVKSLAPQARELSLGDGSALSYDRLVIATGSGLYAPVAGHDLKGVYNFKSLSAAEQLVGGVRAGRIRRAVIVGAGFIGVELALLLQDLGVAVTMVEMKDRLMWRMLEPETAEIVLERVRQRGVEVRLGTRADAFLGDRDVAGVKLESGEELLADAYIAATGVKPNIEWLEGSGVETSWGIIVDDLLRTNIPNVYAAGDVAETRDRMTGEHFVHAIFPNAVAQGRAVANNLLGFEVPYEGAEAMNSLKHLGVEVMAVGSQSGQEELRWRKDGVLRKLFLVDGRIVGFRLVEDIRGAGVYRSLMLRGVDVRPFLDHLLDPRPGAAWFSSAVPLHATSMSSGVGT
jgi:NAD(P)H-nitrite reductase large subunit